MGSQIPDRGLFGEVDNSWVPVILPECVSNSRLLNSRIANTQDAYVDAMNVAAIILTISASAEFLRNGVP
jgi:hypothetical protein